MHEELFWSPLFITLLSSLFTADDVLIIPPLLPLLSPVVETNEPAAFSPLNETTEQDDDTNELSTPADSFLPPPTVTALQLVVSTSLLTLPLILLLLRGGLLEVGEVSDASFRFLAAGCSRVEEEAACSTCGLEDICCVWKNMQPPKIKH